MSEPEPEEDFAALFEASFKSTRVSKGQTIEGAIVAIGPEVAFVNVGGKGEAMIAVDELKDADGDLEVAVGDRIQATVVSTEGGLTLSRKLVRRAATDRQLEDAFRSGLPVEGKVESVVKGGFEVRIARQRAFCPSRKSTSCATPIRPGTSGASTPFGSSSTRKAGGISSSRDVPCSRKSNGPPPRNCGVRSSSAT